MPNRAFPRKMEWVEALGEGLLQELRSPWQLRTEDRPWEGGGSDGGAVPISSDGEGDEPGDPA